MCSRGCAHTSTNSGRSYLDWHVGSCQRLFVLLCWLEPAAAAAAVCLMAQAQAQLAGVACNHGAGCLQCALLVLHVADVLGQPLQSRCGLCCWALLALFRTLFAHCSAAAVCCTRLLACLKASAAAGMLCVASARLVCMHGLFVTQHVMARLCQCLCGRSQC